MSDSDDERVRCFFRSEVLALAPYHVAESSGYVKLDAMENPYAWPEWMVEEWLLKLRGVKPNRYPDPAATALKNIIRDTHRIAAPADLLLGNGSDELIQILMMSLAGRQALVAAPEPTFVMYRQIAATLGVRFVGIPLLADDFQLDMQAMAETLKSYRPALVFLAYPNNPTGNLFKTEDVLRILELAPGLVVLDEAYAPFAHASFMPRLGEYGRLLVMGTVSKLGLAGLRLGFLAGAERWIAQFDKLRLPYNINILTQISAQFALSNYQVFAEQTRRICRDRDILFNEIDALEKVTAFPSAANFILFKLEDADAERVYASLKQSNILIKNMNPAGGVLTNCLRVTVGTEDENRAFLTALKKALAVS